MTEQDIEKLAVLFSGPCVIHNSIQLGMGGGHAKMAQQYFDARSALGINGYDTKEEATAKIKVVLK